MDQQDDKTFKRIQTNMEQALEHAKGQPSYAQLVRTLEYIKHNWDNSWLTLVIEQTLDGEFGWMDASEKEVWNKKCEHLRGLL